MIRFGPLSERYRERRLPMQRRHGRRLFLVLSFFSMPFFMMTCVGNGVSIAPSGLAARGGLEGKRYPWGDELGTGNANDNMGSAVPVGLYPPNGYGLYDMAGNIFEWVWDWGSEEQAYDWAVDGAKNPRGPESSDTGTRIRRGGAYRYGSRHLKCSDRMFRIPTYTAPYFGFRSATSRL
jgi:hypothetical protein